MPIESFEDWICQYEAAAKKGSKGVQDDEKSRIWYLLAWLVLAGLLITSLAVAFSQTQPVETITTQQVERLDQVWDETEDGVYRYTVPEEMASDHLILLIKTYLTDFTVRLDGKELYTFDTALSNGSVHRIPIPKNSVGKELVFQTNTPTSVGKILFGNQSAVYGDLIMSNLYAIVFSIFAFLFCIIVLVAACYIWKTVKGNIHKALFYLAGLILDAGIWVLTDSELLLLMTGHVDMIRIGSFTTFLIMPVFLLRFIQCVLYKSRIRKIWNL